MENRNQQYNISTHIPADGDDFFEGMYSNSGLKQLSILTFIIGTIFGLILEFGIIWYERNGNHRYRTVINQMFSTISWLVVSYILLVYIPDGIRYLIGPLSTTLCDLHLFLKNFLCICVLLTLDCIILLRYIFIFKLSNFAVVNDDLVATFLQFTILLSGLWMTAVKRMSVGRMPLNFFMCSGENPDGDVAVHTSNEIIRKFDTRGILVVISLFLNMFVSLKIFLYQRKMERSTRNIELGRINEVEEKDPHEKVAWNNGNQTNGSNIPKSMADLTTQALCMIFQVTFVIVNVAMNRIEPLKLNDDENRWLGHYIQIIGIAVAILGISIQYYVKRNSLSSTIWKNLKEKFSA